MRPIWAYDLHARISLGSLDRFDDGLRWCQSWCWPTSSHNLYLQLST